MQKLAQQALERMKKSLKALGHMHDIAALASMSKDVVGTALSACPPASLAWAGVCAFILPVRDTNFRHAWKKKQYADSFLGHSKWD
jgi:hypothetical protein